MITKAIVVLAAWMAIAVGVTELMEAGRQAVVRVGVDLIELAAGQAERR